jgi:superfamily I DNA and/or RNA helicase
VTSLFRPLAQYGRSLQVVAFLGDDMQLPPFGQSEIAMHNPFSLLPKLIKAGECDENFLKHQYRMHFTIAKFLDLNVYFGRLITPLDRIMENMKIENAKSPISWINVVSRQSKSGFSTMNHGEVAAIRQVIIARKLEPSEYAVITGYDAQRNLLARGLEDIGGKERVYTVDSYQGHEAPIGKSCELCLFSSFCVCCENGKGIRLHVREDWTEKGKCYAVES